MINGRQRQKFKMVDKDIALEKFSGTNAREWALWLEDYRIFGTLKKWNEEKLISNLRFFVTGDIKDCVRQKCGDKPKDLEELEAEVTRFLGGTLDPISAVHEQGWNFGRFLVLLGSRRLYSLSGKYSPSIPFPIEPEVPGTQSTRLHPQFHTESLIGKPMA